MGNKRALACARTEKATPSIPLIRGTINSPLIRGARGVTFGQCPTHYFLQSPARQYNFHYIYTEYSGSQFATPSGFLMLPNWDITDNAFKYSYLR